MYQLAPLQRMYSLFRGRDTDNIVAITSGLQAMQLALEEFTEQRGKAIMQKREMIRREQEAADAVAEESALRADCCTDVVVVCGAVRVRCPVCVGPDFVHCLLPVVAVA